MKGPFQFKKVTPFFPTEKKNWEDWKWQMRNSLKTFKDFDNFFDLTESEKLGLQGMGEAFKVQVTPYYASLARQGKNPLRRTFLPLKEEYQEGLQSLHDPLGEKRFGVTSRIIHRYPDRVLFLVTDICGIYCRYCTRKHFTGKGVSHVRGKEYEEALSYIRSHQGVREVILSGGDALTLSENILETYLKDIRKIDHVEIIRIGTRMPVVNPMRINKKLVQILKKYGPVYMMVHFNHPKELSFHSAKALKLLSDGGIPLYNQMVLIKGLNDHSCVIQALSRRLLYLRVKPYYMFQCDPSEGTDHLRVSLEKTLKIQKELWGRMSGLALPNFSLDIPGGGGKVGLVPNFFEKKEGQSYFYKGWDGVKGCYKSPLDKKESFPVDWKDYEKEWENIKEGDYGLR